MVGTWAMAHRPITKAECGALDQEGISHRDLRRKRRVRHGPDVSNDFKWANLSQAQLALGKFLNRRWLAGKCAKSSGIEAFLSFLLHSFPQP